ncbi:MAG TPA: branched-chain amino acid ABC transporter permease [Myxococcales bacterium]|jgi:branched-chain amino acid transport system permease protein|nr:branched-chain amino acid ABC transporter permease [Myxococcales bacterium]
MSAAGRVPDARWRPAELVFWAAAVAVYFVFPHHLVLASQILITGLFALSLDLILGYAGIVSLGHAAMFGSGAYAAGLLAHHGWGEPVSGLLAGGAAGAALAFATSFVALRGGDLTRLMVTLGIGLMAYEVANQAASITGGVDGLSDVAMGKLLGLFAFDLGGRTAYVYSLAVLFAVFCLSRRIVNSPFGLSLRGIRDRSARMPALGAPVSLRLTAVYTVAGGIAGIAGALLAQTTQFVGLETLGFSRSADLLIMLVLGGAGWLYGGMVGAAAFLVAQDLLSGMNPVYWQFWLGLLLVLAVFFVPGGIVGTLAGAQLRRLEARR